MGHVDATVESRVVTPPLSAFGAKLWLTPVVGRGGQTRRRAQCKAESAKRLLLRTSVDRRSRFKRLLTLDRLMPVSDEAVNAKGRAIARAKAAAYLPPVKLMQRGGSLEDELCPDEIEAWTIHDVLPAVFPPFKFHSQGLFEEKDNGVNGLLLVCGGDILTNQGRQKQVAFLFTRQIKREPFDVIAHFCETVSSL